MGDFYAGLDLGQASDYTALAIIERVEVAVAPAPPPVQLAARVEHYQQQETVGPRYEVQYHLRHLERFPIGTPYTDVVRQVANTMRVGQLSGAPLVIDRTGVGRPVFDMFAEANLSGGCIPITITGADSVQSDGIGWRVPKRELVSTLEVLLQPGAQRLKIPHALDLGPVFAAEALNFKAKINERGHDSYEAGPAGDWRDGAHDDIVLAVSMVCWYADRAIGHMTLGPKIW